MSPRLLTTRPLLATLSLALACGAPPPAPDGGPGDAANVPDAGSEDGGPPDGGPPDAPDPWARPDAGPDLGPSSCEIPAIPAPDPTVTAGLAWNLTLDLTARADHHLSSCAPVALAPDAVAAFEAPSAGRLVVETTDPALDTILSVRTTCGDASTELGCSDDSGGKGGPSRVVLDVAAGQTIFLIVEARVAGATIPVRLTLLPLRAVDEACDPSGVLDACVSGAICATPASGGSVCRPASAIGCPPGGDVIELAPFLVGRSIRYAGSFAGLPDTLAASSCTGAVPAAPEAVHRLVMPFRGMLDVIAFGTVNATLYVRTACSDPATEVACDLRGGLPATTSPIFDAGTEVFLVVEDPSLTGGAYELLVDLDRLALDGEPCQLVGLGIDRCDPASTCRDEGGTSRVCRPIVCGDGWLEGTEFCDWPLGVAGDGCSDACVHDDTCAAPIDLAAFATLEGTTLVYRGNNRGSDDRLRPGCIPAAAAGGGGDVLFTYTAPASGTLRVTTVDPIDVFDTVVYVRDSCSGADLACNDDTAMGVLPSTLTLPVVLGQTVLLVVDGYGAANRGSFALRVTLE